MSDLVLWRRPTIVLLKFECPKTYSNLTLPPLTQHPALIPLPNINNYVFRLSVITRLVISKLLMSKYIFQAWTCLMKHYFFFELRKKLKLAYVHMYTIKDVQHIKYKVKMMSEKLSIWNSNVPKLTFSCGLNSDSVNLPNRNDRNRNYAKIWRLCSFDLG